MNPYKTQMSLISLSNLIFPPASRLLGEGGGPIALEDVRERDELR